MTVRTKHDLLDVSTFNGQHYLCTCTRWRWVAPSTWDLADMRERFDEHVAWWAEAEAELDEAETA